MKLKNARKADYRQLKRKVFLRLLIVMVLAVLTTLFLRSLYRGQGGDLIVNFLKNSFCLEQQDAHTIYQFTIRNNLDYIVIISVAIFAIAFFYILIRWLTTYFDQINAGIDALIDAKDGEIVLSPEMGFMEIKLNALKRTLESRERNAQLAEQRKNDLVMYLAHDIRTPLTSVIGYLSLLEEAPDMPAEQKAKYVHITLDKACRLEKMINEFFEITRYNLQQISLSKEPIDLYYMLVQLSDELSPVLLANDNTTILNADENLTVYGDPDKLARVFSNVLKNAAAYSYPHTEIIVSAEKKDKSIIISFQNKGETIPKEKLSTIFEKFYRLDEARISNTGGAGLGLAIAKEIVTLHGGTITANSENDTIAFIITLPTAP